MRPFGYKVDLLATSLFVFRSLPCLVIIEPRQKPSSLFLSILRRRSSKMPSSMRWPLLDLEWIARAFWHSTTSGLITSRLWTSLALDGIFELLLLRILRKREIG